ncbi:MAG: response regulator [Planctomycetes bacterium]|nr:response regulator [Planctomycetota bacterium]
MADLLLVDNDRRIVDLAAWFLERRGYGVRTALSYRDARVAIRERRPDLMLADLELGDENGREELPRLAKEGLLPKTLVVSGFLDAALDAELRALEAVVDTLAKPYDMAGLEARIVACLALPEPNACAERAEHVPAETAENESEAPDSALPARNPSALEEPAEDDDGWIEIVPLGREPGAEA